MSYTLNRKLQGLNPYDPICGDYPIRLDANESFLDVPGDVFEQFYTALRSGAINRYPDPSAASVRQLYGEIVGVRPECITVGNGSDELLQLIMSAFLMKGEKLLCLTPEFSMYKFYAAAAEAEVVEMPKQTDYSICADAVIERAKAENVRVLAFSNPCNPTGTGLVSEEVLKIVSSLPECLVVVDEAYMDFWNQSIMSHIEEYDNLIVLRTCSKAYRMAGIRCGFALANTTLTNALQAVKSPYNVSTLTQTFACAMLSQPDEIRSAIARIIVSRDYLQSALSDIAARYPGVYSLSDTCANFSFLTFAPGTDYAKQIFNVLKEKGIVVRNFGTCLRITCGSDEENTALLDAFEEALKILTK